MDMAVSSLKRRAAVLLVLLVGMPFAIATEKSAVSILAVA